MRSTLVTRALPCFAFIIPLLAGCPPEEHSVGNDDDAGTTSDGGRNVAPDTGHASGCDNPNPGCCGVNSDGCEAIVANASCLDGAWTCPSGDTVGPVCDTICAHPVDAGSSNGCSDPSPGCCGFNSENCKAILDIATCEDGAWTCPSGDTVGPVCDALCLVDGSAPLGDGGNSVFLCGDKGLTCDSATQFCYISEGGAIQPDGATAYNPSCMSLPSSCASAPTCECIEAQLGEGNLGNCTTSGGAFTVTFAAP